MESIIISAVCGAIIGIANIIPGVSGGTMAVILNVYDKLIEAVTGLRKNFKKSVSYLLPIGIGAVTGIFGFSKLLEFLLSNFPLPTFFFFIGLIIGSIPFVFKKATEEKFKPSSIISFLVFFAIMIALALINTDGAADTQTASVLSMNVINWFYLFFGSILAAMCMIIPGVSGSMILMIIGLYPTVLVSISHILSTPADSIMKLIPVGLGVLVGIFGGAKLIDICIKKFPQMTFFGIIGLMAGSVISIGKESGIQNILSNTNNSETLSIVIQIVTAVIMLAFGFAVAFVFSNDKVKEKFKSKKNLKKSENK